MRYTTVSYEELKDKSYHNLLISVTTNKDENEQDEYRLYRKGSFEQLKGNEYLLSHCYGNGHDAWGDFYIVTDKELQYILSNHEQYNHAFVEALKAYCSEDRQ